MNSSRREVMPTDEDDQLVTALQQWAKKPVGILSSDLHSQVVSRMAEPGTIVEYRRMASVICVLLFCSTVVGWWLFISNGNGENVAGGGVTGEDQTIAPTISSKSRDIASPIIKDDMANSVPPIHRDEQDPVGLQEVQQQLESLRTQLIIGQLDARFSEMEEQCRQLKEIVALREQSCALATIKSGVITDWLANQ